MHVLLMTSWLCLPLAPLNPIAEDTLAPLNLHFTAGVNGPNGIVSVGPIMSGNLELLIIHPFMIRATTDIAYGRTRSHLFPQGHLWSMTVGGDAIYYRGTDRLTGYVGAGGFLSTHLFYPFRETADSLSVSEGVTDVDLLQAWGYRLILGLRYHRSYSLELAVSELTPDFRKTVSRGSNSESRSYQTTHTGSFRITLGYLFRI